ncbi:MAG: hypothetical protein ACLQLC_17245 [Candidatus Sulfotelmatobacter sp.]
MAFRLGYSIFVKSGSQRSFPAWLFPAIISFLALVSVSFAQGNNSTSSGSSHAGASAPSVATAASHASVPANSGVTITTHTHPGNGNGNGNGNGPVNKKPNPRQTGYGGIVVYPYLYGVAVPYAVDDSDAAPGNDSDDDAEYQGGPTVFDRRGSGADSYIPPVNAPPAYAQSDDTSNDSQDAESVKAESDVTEPATAILVFKDGHQMEIQNYAVVGQTLYDLTSGRPRKIALADLDLPATEKLNDDRGVSFDLPSGQAN